MCDVSDGNNGDVTYDDNEGDGMLWYSMVAVMIVLMVMIYFLYIYNIFTLCTLPLAPKLLNV